MIKLLAPLSRRLVVLAAAVSLLGSGAVAQQGEASLPGDVSLGKADAPVTVVEYASVGCPHCATFHVQVWPAFKAKYVDTGKVRYVYREMLTGDPALALGGFIAARCVPRARYLDVVDAISHRYDDLAQSIDLKGDLKTLALSFGATSAQFEACYKDSAKEPLIQRVQANMQAGQVRGTPTFVINGRTLSGPGTLEALDAAIAAAGG